MSLLRWQGEDGQESGKDGGLGAEFFEVGEGVGALSAGAWAYCRDPVDFGGGLVPYAVDESPLNGEVIEFAFFVDVIQHGSGADEEGLLVVDPELDVFDDGGRRVTSGGGKIGAKFALDDGGGTLLDFFVAGDLAIVLGGQLAGIDQECVIAFDHVTFCSSDMVWT